MTGFASMSEVAVETALETGPALAGARRRVTPGQDAWRRYSRHRLALLSLFVLGFMVAAIAIGPLLWHVAINDIDFSAMLQGRRRRIRLGTDDLGQDILARLLYGGRISLAVGFAAMLVAVVVGLLVGSVAGMATGWLDTFLMLGDGSVPVVAATAATAADHLSVPGHAEAGVGEQGGVFLMIVVVIGGLRWMPVARLVRAQFLSLREKEFVEAARALGASRWRLVAIHILPNALGPVIVAATIEVASAIIAESTLSFLGLGFPPDIPTWGRMLFDAQDTLDVAPHWAVAAGSAIFVTVLAINFIGDGLRDALDPRRVL